MRTPVVLAILLAVSAGCGTSTPRRTASTTTPTTTTPAHPPVHVSAFARDQMKSGFAAPVELVDGDGNVVAQCTITYDVWRDQYLVRGADYSFSLVSTIPTALGVCLGCQPTVELTARGEPALRGDSV